MSLKQVPLLKCIFCVRSYPCDSIYDLISKLNSMHQHKLPMEWTREAVVWCQQGLACYMTKFGKA